ncbi:hypothetical protein [Mariniflexile sp. AS56]|uniref:hypothetical protein n=1 Tax=Mariniflexile sp. AS56 TaxID=3063957 RepID=UPI0026F25C0A|nr:hypothetical protein [Mariniflexile sp. AS56]MDO7172237.1 hypothetical protein [Mariniflexile sp. AS56]
MEYQDVFILFWEQVKEGIEEGSFAKLTMAKTIGKPNLKNIFVRPVYSKNGFSVLLKYRFRLREEEDIEEELTLDEAFVVLKEHLRNPFSSVIVFTTTKDLLFKINKKGAGTIIENMPTFKNITEVERDTE